MLNFAIRPLSKVQRKIMAKSLKVNFLLNFIYTASGVLFPLITFPYAVRVMGPENIGIVNFQYSIVAYAMLFTLMGVPMYGLRETARLRDTPARLRIMVQSLLTIVLVLNIVVYCIIGVMAFTVPQISEHKEVFFILSSTILLYSLGCEWFFLGIEDFKYITVRGVLVRTLSLLLLFAFVHTKDDILWYAAYVAFAVVGNNLFNFFHLRKYAIFQSFSFKNIEVKKHLRPVFQMFLLTVIISIYPHLSKIILGFLQGNTEVGFFVAANKVGETELMLVAAFTGVLGPRLSYLAETSQKIEFGRIAQQTIDLLLCVMLPLTAGTFILSSEVMQLLSGSQYTSATPALRILVIGIPFITLSNMLGQQVLYALGQERLVLRCMLVNVIIFLIFNFIFVPQYSFLGTAISLTLSEILFFLILYFVSRPYFKCKLWTRNMLVTLLSTLGMSVLCWAISPSLGWHTIYLTPFVGAIIYAGLLFALRHPLAFEAYGQSKSWLQRKCNKV